MKKSKKIKKQLNGPWVEPNTQYSYCQKYFKKKIKKIKKIKKAKKIQKGPWVETNTHVWCAQKTTMVCACTNGTCESCHRLKYKFWI